MSAKIKGRYPYTGLRFYGADKTIITEYSWEIDGEWTPQQEVPLGQQIVGLRCDTESSSTYVLNLSFLLGIAGRKYKSGEIRFPAMEIFPLF